MFACDCKFNTCNRNEWFYCRPQLNLLYKCCSHGRLWNTSSSSSRYLLYQRHQCIRMLRCSTCNGNGKCTTNCCNNYPCGSMFSGNCKLNTCSSNNRLYCGFNLHILDQRISYYRVFNRNRSNSRHLLYQGYQCFGLLRYSTGNRNY